MHSTRVTAGEHKRFQSICQKCTWLVIAKDTCNLHIYMWLWIKWHCQPVHGCILYTQHALRHQQFNMALVSCVTTEQHWTPLWWIFRMRCVELHSLIQSHILPEHSGSAPKPVTVLLCYSCRWEVLRARLKMSVWFSAEGTLLLWGGVDIAKQLTCQWIPSISNSMGKCKLM